MGAGGSAPCGGLGFFDSASGLCWLQQTSDDYYDNADSYCHNLENGLTGWRLPTLVELSAQIAGCSDTSTCAAADASDNCTPDCQPNLSTCATSNLPSCQACAACDKSQWGGPGPGGCYWSNAFGSNCNHYFWTSSKGGFESETANGGRWTVQFSYALIYFMGFPNTQGTGFCVRSGP